MAEFSVEEDSRHSPMARVMGEPWLELPADLYIPPDALELILETFEGPMDLLLYLVRKNNIDILNIPMARLTEQYMGYIDMMRAHQFELAAEYLLMAAYLIEVKSRLLLPRLPVESGEEEDPRAELVRRLLEYEQMKLAGQMLEDMPQLGREFYPAEAHLVQMMADRLPQVKVQDLHAAWMELIQRAETNRHHRISREQLSVREHMTRLLRYLQNRDFVEFGELFNPENGVGELVVTFLALLELVVEGRLEFTQADDFSPIYVKSSHAERNPHRS